ncbi:MAG: hypothetical protein QW270_00235 [Candidatus Bathyarchaeia archaeon]
MLEISEIDKPFRELSHRLLASEVRLLGTIINRPFVIFKDKTRFWAYIFSKKMPWLVKTEKAIRKFKQEIDKIEKVVDLYLNIREAYGRTPSGYIIDMRVIIPDGNREIEYSVYTAFRELLRTSSPLLFDLHIIKLKGRKPEEVIPEGFWRYEWTSGCIS